MPYKACVKGNERLQYTGRCTASQSEEVRLGQTWPAAIGQH